MLRSLYAGISGMKVNQQKLDVIANNIANVGTTAFKSSRVRFQDMVSQSISESSSSSTNTGGVNGRQIGLGVQMAGIDTMVGQGMMQPTSRNLDVAVDGEGYLMVAKGAVPKTNADGTTGMSLSYTRDGALTLDDKGNLLNSDGLRVLGYAVSSTTPASTSLTYAASKPTSAYVDGNGTYAAGTDLVPLVIPESIPVPATAAIPAVLATATTVAVAAVPAVAAHISKITTFSIEKDGQIKAVLEDGKVAVLGQIAMASFKNPAGLEKAGGNLLNVTSNSGAAVIRSGVGTAAANDNSGSYGSMLGGMLEMSNVDLAEQFTDMIVASRAFQAMGKTITTGDEILQDIIGLKR
ncbi:flagellar hook-basal body complex protein [Clostridium estertheticum]|uniref:flagellar hook-basal body complex protein n=1 Tax=Clostridium estertheticum TaxID=238834 RepID=UPI001C7D312A|nr:flagellar hook-basal body complex protein [Clostridium estertheticum]MBX4259202.1 flagellar hook-basal body complex protein [Clostridium estertheticum]WLC68885.1 flagellar hook-basal body complex protein [Clostridium estertheticum]